MGANGARRFELRGQTDMMPANGASRRRRGGARVSGGTYSVLAGGFAVAEFVGQLAGTVLQCVRDFPLPGEIERAFMS